MQHSLRVVKIFILKLRCAETRSLSSYETSKCTRKFSLRDYFYSQDGIFSPASCKKSESNNNCLC